MLVLLGAITVAVVIGIVLLWPDAATVPSVSVTHANGTVTSVQRSDCGPGSTACTIDVAVLIHSGHDRGASTQLTFVPGATDPQLHVGMHIVMGRQGSGPAAVYAFADVQRGRPILLLVVVFAIGPAQRRPDAPDRPVQRRGGQPGPARIPFHGGGLVHFGAVIGALGVLNDVTVMQASSVFELSGAAPELDRAGLTRAAKRIGRDHIASTVYCLVLAYAGSAVPLLLLFSVTDQSVGQVLTSDSLAPKSPAAWSTRPPWCWWSP